MKKYLLALLLVVSPVVSRAASYFNVTSSSGVATVPFYLRNNNFAVGTSTFVVSGGLVMIDTLTPIFSAPLTIGNGGAGATAAYMVLNAGASGNNILYFTKNGVTATQIYSDSSSLFHVRNDANTSMDFWTNGTSRATISSGGNFGIGTATPQAALEVSSPTGMAAIFISSSPASYVAHVKNVATNGFSTLQVLNQNGTQVAGYGYGNSASSVPGVVMGGILSTDTVKIVQGNTTRIAISTVGAVSVQGTTIGDNAVSGFVGESISSQTVTAINVPASGAWGDLAQITLTAGDWDISGYASLIAAGATVTDNAIGFGTTAGVTAPSTIVDYEFVPVPTATKTGGGSFGPWRANITTTTTYYFKFFATYITATPTWTGRISARRIR